MEEEEQGHEGGRITSREDTPYMIWNTQEPTNASNGTGRNIKGQSLYLEHDEIDFLESGSCSYTELLHGGSFSYTELLHAQMYQSMTNIMECDRTDLDNKFNTPEAGEYIHSEQNESPTNQAGAENPWNISLFDSMELDKVNDEQNYQQPSTFAREEQQFPSEESEGTAASEKQKGTHNSRQGQEEEFLNEVDIHNFLGNEEASAKEGNLRNVDSVTKPAVGMRFKSKQEGQEFFNFYSHVAGFCVTTVAVKRTSSKKRNNEITQITMKCNKHGKTKEVEAESVVPIRKSIVIAKTNCKVVLVLSKKEGTWEVTRVNLDHNHELTPNSRFFTSHKYMSNEEKCLTRTLKRTNLETRRIVAVLAYLRGGLALLPYTKKHVTNYAGTINREVTNTDMMEVVRMFNKKEVESPGFYYSFELDEENKVRSIFWADAKSRLMYDICGDCISFDTTFLTNKYSLPFAPFVGVSPHGNTYLFACAFIVNEKASTFTWLFNQFLTAMGGKHPISIITNQDKAMNAAIRNVFTKAIHRVCLFHIQKKAEERVALFPG
uniref:Protein FAR1-RELATED SEQUENCE n=1 Tax=Hordeum vulgare subsp. vulgare TaxID=112509 RepID=A0A8I6XCH0_HORVV